MTDQTIAQIVEEFHVPHHVRRHCVSVANIAVAFGKQMLQRKIKIDLELVRRAALLHDLVRVVDFKIFEPEKFPDPINEKDIECWVALRKKFASRHHADACAEILRERGFTEEARIIAQHGFLQIQKGFDSLEAKLLYYADKRVRHDEVVPLSERLNDGRKRNAPETINTALSIELDKKVHELEKEILTLTGEF